MENEEELIEITEEETPTATQEILAIGPNDVLDDIIEGAVAHAVATENFAKHFEFYGKSLWDWSDDLAIYVPDKPDPEIMRGLYIKLARNIQKATHFYTVASSINSAITGGSNLRKSDMVKAIVESYRTRNARRPSGVVIERMADSYMHSTISTRVAAKIVKDFWRHKLDALVEVRKCLEQIGISLHSEMKYLSST